MTSFEFVCCNQRTSRDEAIYRFVKCVTISVFRICTILKDVSIVGFSEKGLRQALSYLIKPLSIFSRISREMEDGDREGIAYFYSVYLKVANNDKTGETEMDLL